MILHCRDKETIFKSNFLSQYIFITLIRKWKNKLYDKMLKGKRITPIIAHGKRAGEKLI